MNTVFNTLDSITVCEGETVIYPDGSSEVISASTSNTSVLTSINGCDSTVVTNATMNPIIVLSLVSTDPAPCGPTDGTVTIGGLTPATAYNVSYNANPVANMTTDANGEILIDNLSAGTYTDFYIEHPNGCSTLLGGQVVFNAYQTPSMVLANQEVCEADNLLIQTFSSNPAGSTFDWTADLDVGFGLAGTGDIGSFVGVNGTPIAVVSTVKVIPTSAQGCVGLPVDFTVTVSPLPVMIFTGPAQGCEPLIVEFTNTTATVGQNCIWTFGTGATATGSIASYTYQYAGTYDVGLTVTSAEGCVASDLAVDYVQVTSTPVAAFAYTPQITDVSDTEVEFTNNSIDADYYEWSFGDASMLNNEENPIHNYPDVAGQYHITLLATNNNGLCTDSAEAYITINDLLIYYVPNAFTPDGDAFNNTFTPVFTSGFDPYNYHLTVFNRWGEIIFESYNAAIGWDGTYPNGGELCQDGVYVWRIEFKETKSDKRIAEQGHVALLK
jgi:gliding motility-associated-like protein